MNKPVQLGVIFGVLGLIAGYLLFARVGGNYISPMELISAPTGFLSRMSRGVRGIEEIRQRVFIAGGVGAVAGVVVALTRR